MSPAATLRCRVRAGGERQHAAAGAEVENMRGTADFQDRVEHGEAAARRAVVAGAEGERRLDLQRDVICRARGRDAWAPWTRKRPALTGMSPASAFADPVALGDAGRSSEPKLPLAGRSGDQSADGGLVGRRAE